MNTGVTMFTPQDRFMSLPALMSELTEDKDYRIRLRRRGSKVTIMSPHGGFIEPGTSALAEAIAGKTFNFFDFQGLQTVRPEELHVTSTRFRHPVLDEMLSRSQLALSVHGMGDVDTWTLWLGGLNATMKERVQDKLTATGFSVNPTAPMYKGENPLNVVNLVPNKGVQLELPDDLIAALFAKGVAFAGPGIKPKTTRLFKRFVEAVRTAIFEELETL